MSQPVLSRLFTYFCVFIVTTEKLYDHQLVSYISMCKNARKIAIFEIYARAHALLYDFLRSASATASRGGVHQKLGPHSRVSNFGNGPRPGGVNAFRRVEEVENHG